MTTETSRIGHSGRKCRMRIFRILIDMTCQAATTTIPHDVVPVLGLLLADVAAGTLLAQHGIGNAMTERLQIVVAD